MTRMSRFGLGAALAVAFAFTPVARAAEPDKLLPEDSEFVLSVNMKQIVESDIIKKYALEQLKQALQGADARKMLTDLGLDPLKDVDRIVAGGAGKDQTDTHGLLIIKGKFDAEKLFKAAEAQTKKDPDHFTMVKDGKDVMFKYQPDNGNPAYATVVDDSTVIVGSDKKIITTALAVGSKKPTLSKDLTALISKQDDKASMWMVGVTKDKLNNVKLPKGGGAPANLQDNLQKLETVAIVVRVTEDISLDVTLGMANADAADEMGKIIDDGLQQIKGAVPFLAAMNPQMKPLVDVVNTLKSTVKDKSINLTAKMAGKAIGDLIKKGGD
ncbi:MAG: hypothetical protein U0791_18415 [Gemmataceae bacterium]